MPRLKGAVSSKQIDHDFPYQVELIVPPIGFGKAIDTMHAFPRERAMPFMTRGGRDRRTEDIFHTARYCFTTMEHAEAFLERFGHAYSGEIFVADKPW
ncbi:hypothetical protein HW532_12630 [Kaustia mangrovi]|uniref:Uncharacterized protein n=1 Tax=Kaustia mangrovi TaxID=2593653 RepID=A0A7S8C4W9_9HYPH|nr:hypothetical protein [Kaustia mangrovi]QPC43463.1 hypothetical protein HW532_12630 [Kaustia mangrovi]